jgi:ABC-type multidrug transport system fused ATPase/permease subunit
MTGNFYSEPPKVTKPLAAIPVAEGDLGRLLERILKRIHKEERLLVLRRTIIFSIMLAGSLLAIVPTFKILLSDFSQSGFINFFSLIFSDFSSVATYWQTFVMILLETLPVVSLALFLAVLLIFLQSIKSLTKNIKIIKSHYSLAS